MRSPIINLSLAAVIGVVIGLLLQSPDSSTNSSQQRTQAGDSTRGATQASNAGAQAANLDALAQQLQEEILARQTLQKEVAMLNKELSKKIAALTTAKNNEPATDETGTVAHAGQSDTGSTAGSTWFNQQALIDAGMTKSEAEQLKTRFEKLELEKLYLRDQAIREGWSGGRRFRDELQKLEDKTDNIKQELGADAYDAYLFASGQPNRVAVQSVLSSSAADNAGMLAGDQVIRYNGERIYNWRDLRNATTQGDLTETITIEILRDDKPMELYVQRGPLGIRMNSVSVAP